MNTTPDLHALAPVLVTGATGHIGLPLVRMLVARGVRVRVLSRDRARAEALLGPGVEVVEGDFTRPDSLAPALVGCERALFLGSGGDVLPGYAAAFAAAARAAGTRHIVAISSGTIDMLPRGAFGTWHAAMEDVLAATGAATTSLRPDNFATNALRWAGIIRGRATVFSAGVDSLSVPIDPVDIAAVACLALTEPGHEGQVYTLSGPTVMTMREQVAAIAEAIGRPVALVEVPTEKAKAAMVGSGMPPIIADAILELTTHPPRPTTTVCDLTGVAARSFAAWAAENRAAFGA